MPNPECWARLKNSAEVPLRRGVWYRVLSHTPLEAVLQVHGLDPVSVPRPYLDIRDVRPTEWTVLRNPKVAARAPVVFQRGYIVCPGCSERVPLPPQQVEEQLCPRCSHVFAIAWHERYFEPLSSLDGDAPQRSARA